jgi:signal transduction histidine kinase
LSCTTARSNRASRLRSILIMSEKAVTETNNVSSAAPSNDERVAQLIEQLQQRTVALEEANRELRHISHYRSLFLARMSHELRTPLTSILGFAEILLDQEKLTETQRRFCQKIQNSGMQQLTSLNQLVDLSRLESAPAELFVHEFSLADTLRDACAAVGRLAQKNDVTLEYDVAPEITTIVLDQSRVRQILFTFLSWAVSRSRSGQRVTTYAKLLEGPMLQVQIEDEGDAIKDMSRVFDPEEAPRAGKTDLNELGIIVGRRMVEMMKGAVILQNRETGGLRTRLQLPAGPVKGP